MKSRLWSCLCSGLMGVACLLPGRFAVAETKQSDNVQVLGRGPIHEAFAQPLPSGDPKALATAPQPPPEPPQEQPPAQKPEGDSVQWVPGYWQWDDVSGKFIWVTGVWREPPPKRKWVPGAYRPTDKGYQWSPGYWAPQGQDGLNYLPPPPASVDEGPNAAAPDDTANWVPGCWIWREEHYVWRPGYWLTCRPGWVWQPAHYVYSPAGCLFVAGYWDYPLEARGVLFAPVCFSVCPAVWTPSICVGIGCLPGALFVRTGCCSYFYGDYFGASFVACGFTPWLSVSIGRGGCCDPLWGYYRGYYAGLGVSYASNLRTLYADRHAGRAARPPHSLHQQHAVLKQHGQSATGAESLTVLRPLSESAPKDRRLVELSQQERDRQNRRATRLHQAATQRVRSEHELITKHEGTSLHTSPRHVDVQVPRSQHTSHQGGQELSSSAVRKLETQQQYSVPRSLPRMEVQHQLPTQQSVFRSQPSFQQSHRATPSFRSGGGKPHRK